MMRFLKRLNCRLTGHRWPKVYAVNEGFTRAQFALLYPTLTCEVCGTETPATAFVSDTYLIVVPESMSGDDRKFYANMIQMDLISESFGKSFKEIEAMMKEDAFKTVNDLLEKTSKLLDGKF